MIPTSVKARDPLTPSPGTPGEGGGAGSFSQANGSTSQNPLPNLLPEYQEKGQEKYLRVSVVMPSFNHARFIRDAIDSVLSQNYPHFDLHVMDGGSKDETVEILKSYGDRITWVSQKDKGQCDAINRGLKGLNGDIICWLNSDDMFTPGAIRTVAEAFAKNPQVDFLYGKGYGINEAGTTKQDGGVLSLDVWKLIHQRNFIQQPSCFFRKSLFEKVGPVDENLYYVMDWDLWIRFASYRGMYVDDYLSCNREYGQNKTQSGQFERWREIKGMIRRYTDDKWPPVLRLYFLEAFIQSLRPWPVLRYLEYPLSKIFFRGMLAEMSGRFCDGGVEQNFKISVGNPLGKRVLAIQFSPISRYDISQATGRKIKIHWKNNHSERGEIELIENGRPQKFVLPNFPTGVAGFVHYEFKIDRNPQTLNAGNGLPSRKIVAFADFFEPAD